MTATSKYPVPASKEKAREVQEIMDGATTVDLGDLGPGEAVTKSQFEFIANFVRAAQKRLPTEVSIARDRGRKRKARKAATALKKKKKHPDRPGVVVPLTASDGIVVPLTPDTGIVVPLTGGTEVLGRYHHAGNATDVPKS